MATTAERPFTSRVPGDMNAISALHHIEQLGMIKIKEHTVYESDDLTCRFVHLWRVDVEGVVVGAEGAGARKPLAKAAGAMRMLELLDQLHLDTNGKPVRNAAGEHDHDNDSLTLTPSDEGRTSIGSGSSSTEYTPSNSERSSSPTSTTAWSTSSADRPLTAKEHNQIILGQGSLDMMEFVANRLVVGRHVKVLVLDVETLDGSSKVTEIGGVKADSRTGIVSHFHLVTTDYEADADNARFPSQREGYAYGKSERMPLADLQSRVREELRDLLLNCDVPVVVGHALDNDRHWLQTNGVTFSHINTVDTSLVEKAMSSSPGAVGLGRLAARYSITATGPLHNSGNDAAVTWEVFLAQMRQRCGDVWLPHVETEAQPSAVAEALATTAPQL